MQTNTENSMKKLFKRVLNVFLCLAVIGVSASFAACEDIKTLEITVQVYNYTDSAFYAEKDVTMTVSLYRHLAPKTVDYVIEKAKAGYYDDTVFYKLAEYSSQIMVGDLKFDGTAVTQNLLSGKLPEEVYGEFERNGTTGSNLVSAKGSIGMWHGFYASAGTSTYKTTSKAMDSGRGTLFMPTSVLSAYDGYFCVFATFDTTNEANMNALDAITIALSSSDNYTPYVIFYTGEYDAEKPTENYGLTFNAVLKEVFDENYDAEDNTYNGETVFKAEKDQLTEFDYKTVYIPKAVNGQVTAKIKSVKVK